MNKYILGTIVGSSLLPFLKRSGSKSYSFTVDEYISELTNGTGKIRFDFQIAYQPLLDEENEIIIANLDRQIKEIKKYIERIFKQIDSLLKNPPTRDEWTWFEGIDEDNDVPIENIWNHYRFNPNELLSDFIFANESKRLWDGSYLVNTFQSTFGGEYYSIIDYIDNDFDYLTNLYDFIKSSKIVISFPDNMTFENIAKELMSNGWSREQLEPFGEYDLDIMGINSKYGWASKGGPLGTLKGYIEFELKGMQGLKTYLKLMGPHSPNRWYVAEFILKIIQMSNDMLLKNSLQSNSPMMMYWNSTPKVNENEMKIRVK